MELINHDFFLYLDAQSGKVNLIYKRKDGNYGVIDLRICMIYPAVFVQK